LLSITDIFVTVSAIGITKLVALVSAYRSACKLQTLYKCNLSRLREAILALPIHVAKVAVK